MHTPPTPYPSLDQLQARLLAFDGRELGPLRSLTTALPAEAREISRVLGLLPSSQDSIELGATWLVKNLLERCSDPLPAQRSRRLVSRLLDCRLDWSRLHLLQSLPYAKLGPSTCRELEPILWRWLEQIDHGFTRAWVYDALVRSAGEDPQKTTTLLETFAGAYHEERPAVRARLRRLIFELEAR